MYWKYSIVCFYDMNSAECPWPDGCGVKNPIKWINDFWSLSSLSTTHTPLLVSGLHSIVTDKHWGQVLGDSPSPAREKSCHARWTGQGREGGTQRYGVPFGTDPRGSLFGQGNGEPGENPHGVEQSKQLPLGKATALFPFQQVIILILIEGDPIDQVRPCQGHTGLRVLRGGQGSRRSEFFLK